MVQNGMEIGRLVSPAADPSPPLVLSLFSVLLSFCSDSLRGESD